MGNTISMKYFLFLFSALYFSLFPAITNAAGIGVAPKELEVTQNSYAAAYAEVYVHNTGENAAVYVVQADDWSQLILANPERFRLEPGESRSVELTFGQLPIGVHQTAISVIADDLGDPSLPKTGVKIPLKMTIERLSGSQIRLFPIVIGFLLVALALFLLAYLQYKKASKAKHLMDQVQETVLKKISRKALFKHYLKHHALLVISFGALLIAGAFLVASFIYTVDVLEVPETVTFTDQQIRVELQDPYRNRVFFLEAEEETYTPFSALQKVAETYTIPLEFDPPNEMGVFVTMIGGHRNGEDQNYWVYEINNESVPVAADKVRLQAGDELIWKFVQPSDY